MLALLKRNFLLYFRNRSGVFFSLLGALISFVLYIIFLQKNLTDAWAQLPNSGPVLNNWLMSGTLAVTGITTSLAALLMGREIPHGAVKPSWGRKTLMGRYTKMA